MLRRVAIGLLIATAGVAAGAFWAPTVRKHIYLRRLAHPAAEVRLEAMNKLAGLAKRDAGVAAPLVDALLAEMDSPEGVGRQAVDRIAGWSIEHSEAVRARVGELLAPSDEARFVVLADWLGRAGRWGPEHQAVADLVRLEVLYLSDPQAGRRLGALEALEQLGPAAGPFIQQVLPGLLNDPDVTVDQAALRTAAACVNPHVAVTTILVPALDDSSAEVRQAAVVNLGLLRPQALADRIRTVGSAWFVGDASAHREVLWALRETAIGGDLALAAAAEATPDLRRMAAWALGFAPEGEVRFDQALTGLLGDADAVVAARAAMALGRRKAGLNDVSTLMEMTTAGSSDQRLAALYALGRCPGTVDARGQAVTHLGRVFEQAIQQGRGRVAAAAIEALGHAGGDRFLQVMLDVVEEFADQPMLQYTAACAAMELDRGAGAGALLEVCGSQVDEVRELAAFRLGWLADPPVDRLAGALIDGGEPLRGGAALALALAGACDLAPGQDLAPWLRGRFDARAPVFEPSWQVRADYLCARLICGDPTARSDLDVYLLNANVSRMGMFVALLHDGETLPLDTLFSESSGVDGASFLREARFAEVLARYLPQAPAAIWAEDAEVHRFMLERLGDWWRVNRLRVRFDDARRVFVVPESGV